MLPMLLANEPLEAALVNVQTRVTAVQGTVTSIAGQVASLPARVVDALCDVIPGC